MNKTIIALLLVLTMTTLLVDAACKGSRCRKKDERKQDEERRGEALSQVDELESKKAVKPKSSESSEEEKKAKNATQSPTVRVRRDHHHGHEPHGHGHGGHGGGHYPEGHHGGGHHDIHSRHRRNHELQRERELGEEDNEMDRHRQNHNRHGTGEHHRTHRDRRHETGHEHTHPTASEEAREAAGAKSRMRREQVVRAMSPERGEPTAEEEAHTREHKYPSTFDAAQMLSWNDRLNRRGPGGRDRVLPLPTPGRDYPWDLGRVSQFKHHHPERRADEETLDEL